MTYLTDNSDVCIVLIRDKTGATWIFGVYENKQLAKKRVMEQDYLLCDDDRIEFINETVWRVKE